MSSNLNKLVTLLNDGEFHDGNSLGDALNITRSAVWKMIKKLIDYGIPIESIKGKGYQLSAPLILLDESLIQKSLKTLKLKMDVFDCIPSTNTYLRQYFNTKQNRICLAEQQSQGKGRLGREWHSPYGQNIYLSYLHHFKMDLSQLAGLSLVMSLATHKTLNPFMQPHQASVKWPNDIWFNNKKLAGILIEAQAENNGYCSAIIGIGINVNMLSATQKEINQSWTSLRHITNQYTDRNVLVTKLILNLVESIQLFENEGLTPFINDWNQNDCLLNREITIHSLNHTIQGKAKGINEHGQLLLEDELGHVRSYATGDTSIMK